MQCAAYKKLVEMSHSNKIVPISDIHFLKCFIKAFGLGFIYSTMELRKVHNIL